MTGAHSALPPVVAERLAGARVLVTGATGFVGSHLAKALADAGAQVHAIRRRPDASTRVPCADVQWHTADVCDQVSLTRAIDAAAPLVVFHLAAYGTVAGDQDAERAYRVNVEGTWNLWNAAKPHPCRVVYTGTSGEYGVANDPVDEATACEPTWFYPATKNAAGTLLKTLARESGREAVVLRLFGPYGEGDDPQRLLPGAIIAMLRGTALALTAGEQRRDYAHVDDHVRALLLAGVGNLPSPVATYNIGSGRCRPIAEMLDAAAREIGEGARACLQMGAIPYRPHEVWCMCADITRARRDLGWEPLVPLQEGLARTIAWFRRRDTEGSRNLSETRR